MFKKILVFLIAGVFVLSLAKLSFAAGCGMQASHAQLAQAEHSGHTHAESETVPQATSKAAVNVGNKICPVSEELVGEGGMQPATYEYQGKIYNFCCPACIEEFKKDPQKYIKKVEEELKTESSKETTGGQVHQGHHH
jgi:YHS domain-containing protein